MLGWAHCACVCDALSITQVGLSTESIDRMKWLLCSRYPAYPAKKTVPWEWRQIPTSFGWQMDDRALPRYMHASAFYQGQNGESSAIVIFGGLGQMGMPQRGH